MKLSYAQEVELYHACIDAQDFGPLNDYIQEQDFPFRVCMVGIGVGGTLLFSNQMLWTERMCIHNKYWNLGRNNAYATVDLKVKKGPAPKDKVPDGHLFVVYCPHCDYDPTMPIVYFDAPKYTYSDIEVSIGGIPISKEAFYIQPSRTVSVTDFGAKLDGVTDDSAAVQRAFDSGADRITIPQTPEGMRIERQMSFNGDGSTLFIEDEASSLPDELWRAPMIRTLGGAETAFGRGSAGADLWERLGVPWRTYPISDVVPASSVRVEVKEPIVPQHSQGKPNRKRKKRKRKGK